MKGRTLLSILAAGLLAGAVALQALRWGDAGSPGKGIHLAEALASAAARTPARDLALGATENVSAAVETALRFDDALFREFRLPNGTLTVFIAYWGPGKMPTHLVASHTPDGCWTENGWTCEEFKHRLTGFGSERALKPAEWRVFASPGGGKQEVLFWHLVGAEVYDYGERLNRIPSPWRWWRDAGRQIFRAPPEQYFIRLASDRPFAELRGDAAFEAVLAALAQLGLADKGEN